MSTALLLRMDALVVSLQRQAVAAVLVLVGLLFSLPFVTTAHRYPLTTFDSDWLAGGILALAMIAAAVANRARVLLHWPLPAIVLVLFAAATVHYLLGMLQYTYALSSLFIYLCALFGAYLLGRWLVAGELRSRALRAMSVGLLVGGLLSVAVQILQVLDVRTLPTWLVFPIVDRVSSRRPFANLAQPNQLATYLIWATIAAMYLARRGMLQGVLLAAAATLSCGVALTGSRMGSLFVLLALALALTRNAISPETLRERVRVSIALIAGYGAGLVITRIFLADAGGVMATAIERYAEGSFGQRASMWSDALRIALAHPWLGVGVGEYGGAHYLFARLDPSLLATNNAHNIFLHLAAEFGLPVATIVLVVLGWWCWERALACRTNAELTAAFVLVLFVLAHSLLEYPLWHLYFLVATAFLAGVAEPDNVSAAQARIRAPVVFAPIGIVALCAVSVMKVDFDSVAPLWDDFLHEQVDGRPHAPETVAGIIATMGATYFRPQMERLYVELLPVQAQQGDDNLALSARVLKQRADVPVIVRHIQLLLQAGRTEETLPHIERLKVFAADYQRERAEIEESISHIGSELDPVRRVLAARKAAD
jgi:O-antigen ligase